MLNFPQSSQPDDSQLAEMSVERPVNFHQERPDTTYVQEVLARSKAIYRERLAKAVSNRKRS
jgi:hypothetical protein